MAKHPILFVIFVLFMGLLGYYQYHGHLPWSAPDPQPSETHIEQSALPDFLPPEARDTLQRIADAGPFRHVQDGSVFENNAGLLPDKPQGYYHEYTVETPDASGRGARRIVTGGNPPERYYYTDDNYRHFKEFTLDSPQ